MDIQLKQEGNCAFVCIEGKIDEPASEELKKRFYQIHRKGLDEIVFDFRNVTYIGSACIGKLLLFYKELGDIGSKMKIINISPTVYELFKVVKLDTILDISIA